MGPAGETAAIRDRSRRGRAELSLSQPLRSVVTPQLATMMIWTVTLLVLAFLVAGCGMNRAVGVLPNTLDDLGEQTEAWRGDDPPTAAPEP